MPIRPPFHPSIQKSWRSLLAALPISLCLFTGCRDRDPVYARNPELIRLLKKQDALTGRDAEKYVVRGSGGHLFYLEDLRAAVLKWTYLDFNARAMAALSDSLKRQGVRLLIVPVPTKAETYPELLSASSVAHVSPSKDAFLKALDSLRAEALDLRDAFYAAKPAARLFPRTDSHWDQAAIRLAAQAIADKLGFMRESAPAAGGRGPVQTLTEIDTMITGFKGDLAEKFHLPESDTVRLKTVREGGRPYAEPDSAEILLYGDSFLNQYKTRSAHLGAHLARVTGRRVKTVYSLAGFTQGPDKILGLAQGFPAVRTVVWVFTSRTLLEAIPGQARN